jgi:hypothetical protein
MGFGPPRSSGSDLRLFGNPLKPFFQSKPGLPTGYPDPLLTLLVLYPALNPTLIGLPHPSALLKTSLPPSLLLKPTQSLQIHFKCELLNGLIHWGSGNYHHRRCLHLDKWSAAVTQHQKIRIVRWNGSIRMDALHHSSQSSWWQIMNRPYSIQFDTLHITLQSQFFNFFKFSLSPDSNDYSGVVANCNHTTQPVHSVHASIWIAMRWVMMRKFILTFLVLLRKLQYILYWLYTSFQVAWSTCLVTIDRSFYPSPVVLMADTCGTLCAQPPIIPTQRSGIAMDARVFCTCSYFEEVPTLP